MRRTRIGPVGGGLLLAAIGACAIVLAGFSAGFSFDVLAAAYLSGWFFWISVSAGSFVLLLILSIAGGRWEATARPVLTPLALAMPLLALAMLPILFSLPHLYEWAGEGVATKREAVKTTYLNGTGFVLRAVAILLVWSALAWFAALTRPGPFLASLGIIIYVITLFFASVDWIMSIEAEWASTAYPALVAVSQIAGALAFMGIAQGLGEGKAETDIAELLIAAVLGVTYLAFIQALVMWSGNIPDDVRFYVDRFHAGWAAPLTTTFVIGAVIPFLMLLFERVRRDRRLTGLAALFVFCGLALHEQWLLAPRLGAHPLRSGGLAVLGFGALLLGAIAAWTRLSETREEAAHG